MSKSKFPFVALGMGLFIMLLVINGSETGEDGSTTIPLLTLLIVSEFGFFVNAIAVYFGIRQIQEDGIKLLNVVITLSCVLLSIGFLWLGIVLWPFSS
jgi:heme/copper-type cytochrome/quinol oxidase subunit 3